MTKDEALKLALEALETLEKCEPSYSKIWSLKDNARITITAIKKALAQPEQEPVQVSPLEFVTMVMEKEHLIGKPLFWAEWPNKEKNT